MLDKGTRRPTATVKAGVRHRVGPQSTYVTVKHERHGESCVIELVRDIGSGLRIHLHHVQGDISICAPLPEAPHGQCIWSTRYSLNKESAS